MKQPKHYMRVSLGREINTILKIALEELIGNLLSQWTVIERVAKITHCQCNKAKKVKEELNC